METWTIEKYKAYLKSDQVGIKDPKKRPKVSPRKRALKAADREFSLLMRAKAANYAGLVKCCTCGKLMDWKGTGEAHWGHWQSRGFNSTRWDEVNGGVQCRTCNTYLEGEKQKMEAYLIEKHGMREVNRVQAFSRITIKYSEFDLSQMVRKFREERKAIVKEKGL